VNREGLATRVLIGLNVLVFGALAAAGVSPLDPSTEQLLRWGADFAPLTVSGQWWRLGTSMFLHAGLLHLALNMWCLLNLGLVAEILFGRTAFVILYCLSGLGGSLASLFAHPNGVGVGASGAIFGLAGGLITFVWVRREAAAAARLTKMLPSLLSFVAYNLLFGAMNPLIDNSAHLGGLVVGAGFGAVLLAGRAAPVVGARRLAITTLAFGAAMLVGAFVARRTTLARGMPVHREESMRVVADSISGLERATTRAPDSTALLVTLGRLYLQAGRSEEALRTLDRATRGRPEDVEAWRLTGTALLGRQRFDDAVAAFDRVAQLAPRDPAARYDLTYTLLQRGNCRAAAGDRRRAAADFRRVVDTNADSALTALARQSLRGLRP